LTQSAQIRAQVEQAIPEREVDFIKASKELGEMIDDSEDIVQLSKSLKYQILFSKTMLNM